MKLPIVDTFEPVTLLGGGDSSAKDVKTALRLAPTCVAADSGAHLALDMGLDLAAVVGDMDSISDSAKAQIPPDRYFHIAEQDSTDFDKALRSLRAPLVIGVGFASGQVDHTLAALNTLVRHAHLPVVLLSDTDIIFLCPRHLTLDLPAQTRLSLFPMGPVTGRSIGLEWPIDGIKFSPGGRAGTSNRTTGPVTLEIETPRMICILPRGFIQQVVRELLALPPRARWHARAG